MSGALVSYQWWWRWTSCRRQRWGSSRSAVRSTSWCRRRWRPAAGPRTHTACGAQSTSTHPLASADFWPTTPQWNRVWHASHRTCRSSRRCSRRTWRWNRQSRTVGSGWSDRRSTLSAKKTSQQPLLDWARAHLLASMRIFAQSSWCSALKSGHCWKASPIIFPKPLLGSSSSASSSSPSSSSSSSPSSSSSSICSSAAAFFFSSSFLRSSSSLLRSSSSSSSFCCSSMRFLLQECRGLVWIGRDLNY